ncbi:MAG: TIR domain-containing protein [Emergencia sp.]|jgi:tetratricopeptide (TPR) repeat protein|nr:TIR domain-containing protein [Emergencia sp.]
MAIFKCKMCGGTLEIKEGESVAVCEYCGTKQTLPKLDDEKRANLYDRANHFRRCNEYDKAMGIYEQILAEDNTDAESYWSLVLCRYGVEYVEDPKTHKRVPTVNRTQFGSVFSDVDYQKALEHADEYQRTIYEEEAKAIDEIQKGILAISQEEEPFDVFICYKETDHNGRRTPDSVLAGELYHELSEEGFRVFFSRITLEDKLGSAYEPYIFAALNSAKVMVVMGTTPEHFNAVWVKNEWSRYLALIKSGAKKTLIPAYKDMDPYDLPEEFSHLQAQDMSKLGFMQDLIRGIEKLAEKEEREQETERKNLKYSGGGGNVDSLLKRVFMFLEDKEWDSADEYCERVLDIDPENVQAYLGKLLASYESADLEQLKINCWVLLGNNSNYKKILKFGETELVAKIQECNEHIRKKSVYNEATVLAKTATTADAYREIGDKFQSIADFQDAGARAKEYLELADKLQNETAYCKGLNLIKRGTIDTLQEAVTTFEDILDYQDSKEQIEICRQKIEILEARADKQESRRKKLKRIIKIAVPTIAACLVLAFVVNNFLLPEMQYRKAIKLKEEGKISEAVAELNKMDGYKDAEEQLKQCFNSDYGKDIDNFSIGDSYYFGNYEQDGDVKNGTEVIKWTVLDKKDSKLLLLSNYILDYKPYKKHSFVTGEKTVDLSEWLDENFRKGAFSEEERKMLAKEDGKYKYLLSANEVRRYFPVWKDRIGIATTHAKSVGEGVEGTWWVTNSTHSAVSVNGNLIIAYINDIYGIRPAIWIDLS